MKSIGFKIGHSFTLLNKTFSHPPPSPKEKKASTLVTPAEKSKGEKELLTNAPPATGGLNRNAQKEHRLLIYTDLGLGLNSSVPPMFSSVQFSSVAQSCPTLSNPMNHSTPGLPVHHQLPEFTQTHVHRVSDAIQPSHPLASPSPPAPNPSQHQSLFQ